MNFSTAVFNRKGHMPLCQTTFHSMHGKLSNFTYVFEVNFFAIFGLSQSQDDSSSGKSAGKILALVQKQLLVQDVNSYSFPA